MPIKSLIKLLELYPDKDWDWYGLSYNTNITWEIVQNNQYKYWNWIILSQNTIITWKIFKNNIDK